jgi:hypothetical protein
MLVAVLAVPISVLSVTLNSGAASAKSSGPKGKITCTSMNGSETGTITISGCAGTAVPGTGGSSRPLTIASLATGGPVTWVNGQVTDFAAPALNESGKPKHCPGYVKPPKTGPQPNEPSLIKFSGQVTSDNTGLKIPGKYKGEVCVSQSGNITAAKPLKIS